MRTVGARGYGYESGIRRRVRFVAGFAQGKKPKSASHDRRNEGSKDSSRRLRDLAERTQPFLRISNGRENYGGHRSENGGPRGPVRLWSGNRRRF